MACSLLLPGELVYESSSKSPPAILGRRLYCFVLLANEMHTSGLRSDITTFFNGPPSLSRLLMTLTKHQCTKVACINITYT